MGNILGEKLIAHRQTKTFTVHTSTALQLKANTSPKPSTPCYYCDIFNLSLPMTGLMIMFPVLFQPQITANSVIKGLLWPLCQPSSGSLTVSWPGDSLLKAPACVNLWVQRAYGNLEGSEAASQDFQAAVVTVKSDFPCLITIFNTHFSCVAFLSELYNCHSPIASPNFRTIFNLHWTLKPSPIVLTWSSSMALLRLKGSFITLLSCACSLFNSLFGGRTCHFVFHYSTEDWNHNTDSRVKARKSKNGETSNEQKGNIELLLSDIYTIACYKKGDFCKCFQCFHLLSFLAYTFEDSWGKSCVRTRDYQSEDTIFLRPSPASKGYNWVSGWDWWACAAALSRWIMVCGRDTGKTALVHKVSWGWACLSSQSTFLHHSLDCYSTDPHSLKSRFKGNVQSFGSELFMLLCDSPTQKQILLKM